MERDTLRAMRERGTRGARRYDEAFTWLSLCYGVYCAAFDAAYSHDELQIAFGVEMIVIALLDFMWAGARRSLGYGLIVAGLSAPVIGLGSAPLFWHQVQLFSGPAFWTAVIVGGVAAVPLIGLGWRALRPEAVTAPTADPPWLTPVRWGLRVGLWLIVLAFRLGDFRSGTLLVYIGAALSLASLSLGLPRRLAMGPSGVGKLLLLIGASALSITLVAGVAVGGHMSRDEAMLAIGPALVLVALGGALSLRRAG